jgi:hypothetical protein
MSARAVVVAEVGSETTTKVLWLAKTGSESWQPCKSGNDQLKRRICNHCDRGVDFRFCKPYAGDCRIGRDFEAELDQLAVNAWRAPSGFASAMVHSRSRKLGAPAA